MGGEGDKVFPATYAEGAYATEKRRLPNSSEPVDCTLLDSVQSQSNRAEESLKEEIDRGAIHLPLIAVDFTEANYKLRAPLTKLTSLDVPHRLADAILRDSVLLDGTRFSKSEYATRWGRSNLWNATAIFELCPTALVFGMWGSPEKPGGLGAKFERAYVSEILAVDVDRIEHRFGFRIDPLNASKGVSLKQKDDGSFEVGAGKLRPSELNHGNIPFESNNAGIRFRYAQQTTVVSLGALRKLRFPINGKEDPAINSAARTVLAAIGLSAGVFSAESGTSLRSRCHLWPTEERQWELLEKPGQMPRMFQINKAAAAALLNDSVAAAKQIGLPWMEETLFLRPSPELVELVRQSQELAVKEKGRRRMTAIGIRYLTGNVVATSIANRGRPEWPPHPGRVFMAITAAHFETGAELDERPALEWLEDEPAPSIYASEAFERSPVETYVPVNDKHGGIVKRARQARSFPTARPVEDSVFFLWDSDAPPDVRTALEKLCAKVTRIGHSSSLVQMWIVEEVRQPQANWFPDNFGGEQRMRVAPSGTLHYLQKSFNSQAIEAYSALQDGLDLAKGKARTNLTKELKERFPLGAPMPERPQLSTWQGYSQRQPTQIADPTTEGPFDPNLIVLTPQSTNIETSTRGPRLGLESTLQLTGALRDAAMKALSPATPPEWLSGHQPDGTPTRSPHMAFFALPFVGDYFADGHVMGLAMAVPRKFLLPPGQTPASALRKALGPLLFKENGEDSQINLWKRARDGQDVWRWRMARETRERPPITLRKETWTEPSLLWASVTPVVLHHYPKHERRGDIERILRDAFASALLPEPAELSVVPVSIFKGAGHARSIPEFTEGGTNLCRYQTHVVVRFPQKVQGPVLVGRGRFRGYGLFRPAAEKP